MNTLKALPDFEKEKEFPVSKSIKCQHNMNSNSIVLC